MTYAFSKEEIRFEIETRDSAGLNHFIFDEIHTPLSPWFKKWWDLTDEDKDEMILVMVDAMEKFYNE